jgi:hypothetical protein
MKLFGLLIVSIALGSLYSPVIGWLVLGGGIILFECLNELE